ncbi:restriction endonuclease subunit S [Shewanella baltica]|uniref:restriction endonuclease subunit S n=1 Tax=Shewanella baltica TaxID=62322 RepID=UPI00217CF36E|nr:restriction endonuclease subunit S [Shewanella baltica]
MKELETIPQLRFTEFSKEWKPTKLVDHSTSVMYGMNSSAVDYDGKHGYIRITDIDDSNCFSPNPLTSPDGQIKDKFRLKGGDLVFARTGANTGKSYLYKESDGEIYFAGFLIKVSVVDAVPEFIFQNTFRPRYDNWVHVMSMRSGQPGINAEEYKSYPFYIPERAEQQKIADFLSSVDKKIALLKEKHALLEQYKKGVMQKLFSQEIRFKDENGNNFPDWQEKPLAQVLVIQVRETPKPNEKYLALGIRSHVKGTFQKPNFDPTTIMMDKLYIVRPNDLIINITFAWEGAVAIAKNEDDGGLVSHRFPTYTFKDGESTYRYFKHIISLKRFRYMLDLISPGGAGRNRVLSKKEFLKLKWNLPNVEEQLKIAGFLDALDNKIELLSQQIEQTQTFKKGLLQKMFV